MSKRKLEFDEDALGAGSDPTGVSGPSSQQQQKPERVHTRASPSKSKRPRKDTEGSDATSPEKRGAMFKKSCPQKILERVARVMSQR